MHRKSVSQSVGLTEQMKVIDDFSPVRNERERVRVADYHGSSHKVNAAAEVTPGMTVRKIGARLLKDLPSEKVKNVPVIEIEDTQ